MTDDERFLLVIGVMGQRRAGRRAVNGIQAEGVISTLKHFCLNCDETNRHWLDAVIDPVAHRESDLLAFQIAIERCAMGSNRSLRMASPVSFTHSSAFFSDGTAAAPNCRPHTPTSTFK